MRCGTSPSSRSARAPVTTTASSLAVDVPPPVVAAAAAPLLVVGPVAPVRALGVLCAQTKPLPSRQASAMGCSKNEEGVRASIFTSRSSGKCKKGNTGWLVAPQAVTGWLGEEK